VQLYRKSIILEYIDKYRFCLFKIRIMQSLNCEDEPGKAVANCKGITVPAILHFGLTLVIGTLYLVAAIRIKDGFLLFHVLTLFTFLD